MKKINCIFFSEFHPVAGPKLVYQYPEDYISREQFDSVHQYIIPKTHFQARVITINTLKHKIVGCPVCIQNVEYQRNAYIFNLCFVFDVTTNTLPYESVVKKLSVYLTTLERERQFLSKEEKIKENLPGLLKEIKDELNGHGSCCIPIDDSTTIHLKVVPMQPKPITVDEVSVPIFAIGYKSDTNQWDLATQQLIPYIDGFKHLAKISAEADVDVNIVKVCVQNLVHYGMVKVISIFQYSNVYVTTPNINRLAEDGNLQQECVHYVARPGKNPEFSNVFAIYCELRAGITVRDLCNRCNPYALGIDERKLIQYGLMNNLIRRLQKYPVKLPNEAGTSRLKDYYRWFNGCHSFDEICCKTSLSVKELDEKIENDPSIVVCWK